MSDDLAKILRDHRQHVSENFPAPGVCVSRCADSQPRWPCGAYRAAAAAEAAVAKLARIAEICRRPPLGTAAEERWAADILAIICCDEEAGDG